PGSWALNKTAQRAGLRVSEMKQEISVEAAIVIANCRKNWPEMPERNADGTNTAHSVSAIEISAPPTSFIVTWAASTGLMPRSRLRSTFSTTTMASSTTMPSQHEAEQRQIVEGDAEHIEEGEGAEQRDRDRDHGDDRGAPALQEQEHDANHQEDRDKDGLDHLVDGLADKDGGIIDHLVVEAGRKRLAQRLHGVEHLMFDGERVGAGLSEDQ